jgi:hypothetical protein
MKHAILLPGLLRCVDDIFLNFMDTASGLAKIFIVTEIAYKDVAEFLVSRYQAHCIFTENLDDRIGAQHNEVLSCYKTFFKLEAALAALKEWEAREAHQFDYIHQFRTDMLYSGTFTDHIGPLLSQGHPGSCLVNQHQMNFSGTRNDVMRLQGISTFLNRFMNDPEFYRLTLCNVNLEALKCSTDKGVFQNSLPVVVLNHETEIQIFHETCQSKYHDFIAAFASFRAHLVGIDASDPVFKQLRSNDIRSRTFVGRYWPFYPEHIYAQYLNSLGFSTKLYPSWLELRHSRFAVTEPMKLICDQIQLKDFSFLDSDLQWDTELHNFRSSSGNIGKLFQIFTYVNLFALSDEQCMKFYSILELLKMPAAQLAYYDRFLNDVKRRGLGIPDCLKVSA